MRPKDHPSKHPWERSGLNISPFEQFRSISYDNSMWRSFPSVSAFPKMKHRKFSLYFLLWSTCWRLATVSCEFQTKKNLRGFWRRWITSSWLCRTWNNSWIGWAGVRLRGKAFRAQSPSHQSHARSSLCGCWWSRSSQSPSHWDHHCVTALIPGLNVQISCWSAKGKSWWMKCWNRCSLSYSSNSMERFFFSTGVAYGWVDCWAVRSASWKVQKPGLALVDVVPYCSPVLVSKIGSPHPCPWWHRQIFGTERAACEHTLHAVKKQTVGNEIQNAS